MDANATCHRTLAVQDCLDSKGIQRLVWPACSPDLNPIENVRDALGRQVAGRNYPPTNKNTLIRALTEEWDKLPQQLLDNVVQTTRGLLATDHVILNHGQVTWTTPELAPPLLTTTPHQREDVSALDRFNVHRCPTRRVFSGTGLEPVTKQATVRYLYNSATAATLSYPIPKLNQWEGKAMKIVNSHCSALMERYTQCVERYPNVWNTACSYQRHELARCSETHPIMLKAKIKCSSVFDKYERCHKKYPQDHSRCSSSFNNFLNCVETVAEDGTSS
ncbi:CX9C domain-containing protein [Trichonephila clavipes]|nr:CX9C domain-containing protein [Trichonephila clavipes]